MSENKNYLVGLGLVFGAGIGSIIAVILSLNIAITMSAGAGIGLIIGTIIRNNSK